MPSHEFDVCAIGNALVDVIAETTDQFLEANKIAKGGMTLIDAERAGQLYDLIGPAIETSGGSAGNTVAGIASLGGKPAFMGKVKADQLGAIYRHDMHAMGVHFATPQAHEAKGTDKSGKMSSDGETAPTGRCIVLVTPDAQRSMNTYLGAAVEFGANDVSPEIIRASQITYLEGYLFDRPPAKEAFHYAARITHESGRKLSLTLSDTFCVNRHRPEFLELVKSDVDILFANKAELMALYETNDLSTALTAVSGHCKIAAVTLSEDGAVIVAGDTRVEVAAERVNSVVDSTGAGDLFAAGFLFGYAQKLPLDRCAHLGAICAAEVISHYGPRPRVSLKDLVNKKIAA